jgi:D-cysteine desulfhydrase family pyridoxal phosphate-dependent enzyme
MRDLPRIKIAHLPTPVEFLPNLTGLFGGPKIYTKRDDQTGLAMGGNKARKLEFLLAEALTLSADTLITAGAAQSNHCRQTAAAAARCQLACILILIGDEPVNHTANLLLDDLFGAEVRWTRREHRDAELEAAFQDTMANGRHPYLIPYGGSNPVGACGYMHAITELLEQWDETLLNGSLPDWIILPSGSGGTQAGLVLGAKLFHYSGRILGISVDEHAGALKDRITRLATDAAEYLGMEEPVAEPDVLVNSDYVGGGYGVVGPAELEAIRTFARSEGLLLDPVYTGRAAAGMIDLISKNTFRPDESILFWHTGGVPALFADRYSGLFKQLLSAE